MSGDWSNGSRGFPSELLQTFQPGFIYSSDGDYVARLGTTTKCDNEIRSLRNHRASGNKTCADDVCVVSIFGEKTLMEHANSFLPVGETLGGSSIFHPSVERRLLI